MHEHDADRDPPPADLLAAEYVLGVLDARGRRDARLRAMRDAGFARLVDDWAARLDPLHDDLPPADVPAHVWPRVRAALGWSAIGRAPPQAAFWKFAAAAGFAAAAVLAVVVLRTPGPAPTASSVARPVAMPEMPVTRLVGNDGRIAYLATVDAHGGGMWLVPVPGSVPQGAKAPVLWLIPPGKRPKSLGYVGASRSHWVDVPRAELHAGMHAGWTVAITLEPVRPVAPQAPSSPPMAAGTLSL